MNAIRQHCDIEVIPSIETQSNFTADLERERGEDEERLRRVQQQAAEELA